MKQIRQFRYYGDNNSKNYPTTLTRQQLCDENIFELCGEVSQLGIQALPGTIFYLNGGEHSLMIGSTGIYELDLNGLTTLKSIQFETTSLENLYANGTNGLIIDVIYNVT